MMAADAVEGARVCVGIATRGRPQMLRVAVEHLQHQSLPPASIIVSCTSADDLGTLPDVPRLSVLHGPPGAVCQRNAILQNMPTDTDILVFFDDDFLPHPDWLAAVARAFHDDPAIACITGNVLKDGIKGPGLSVADATQLLARADQQERDWVVEGYSPYGCNMAFRRAAVGHLRFDERLVLYGWLEDRDFGAMIARDGGRLIKLGAAMGVHLGIKSGRVSGEKLGYSQVMNPIYLWRKGTMTPAAVVDHIWRNVTANLVRSIRSEPYIDRIGRLRGNLIAFEDLLRGRLTPERAKSL